MNRDLAVCLLLVAATLAVYGQTVRYDFVNFDDDHYVYENPHVRKGLTPEGIRWAFTAFRSSNWHPVTWLSHMLDCELFGLKAGYHHLVNVLLHILNSLLLYLVLRGMTGAVWRSAMVAALFALHPLHVESVAWVSERKDVLSTLFFMLTLHAYARYTARPGRARYGWVAAFLALGLMAKPMLVTLPFVLLLLDYWPLGRLRFGGGGRARESGKGLLIEKTPLFALAAASCLVTFVAQQHGGATRLTYVVPFGTRVANALVSYAAYLGKTILPAGLAAFYPYRTLLPASHTAMAGAALAVITALAIAAGRRRGYAATGWFWYMGTLVPVIGLIQVGNQSMADRYTYIPLIGIFLVAVWGAADLAARLPHRRVWLTSAAVLVTFGCMAASWFQVRHWRNGVELFEHALRVTRDNATARNNLGYALEMEGRPDEAALHYRQALRVDPQYSLAHSNLANVLVEKGRLDEAISHYQEAVRINPRFDFAYTRLGMALARQGRMDEAVAAYRRALRLAPENPNTHSRLGVALMEQGHVDEGAAHCRDAVRLNPGSPGLHNNLGLVLARQGRQNEAVAHFREALRLDPAYAKAHDNLGLLLARRGREDEAIAHFRKAVALDADDAEAHKYLAMALGRKGAYREAIAQYREAIRLRPDDPGPYNDLAWILATRPEPGLRNGAEAVKLAEKACRLQGTREITFLDTLAAAYAEAGRFPAAVATLEEAVSLAASRGRKEEAMQLRKRLQGYQAGRPYREPAQAGGRGRR